MYIKTTRGIKITVLPAYQNEDSTPSDNHYIWSYTILVENLSDDTVQLLNRYWKITGAHGLTEEVKGEGVVGMQPTLQPGERFQYTSGVLLLTPSGIMVGTYQFLSHTNNKRFTVPIPAFSLDSPYQVVKAH